MANDTYLTAQTQSDLPYSRVLTAGNGLSTTDGGAGSTFTIRASGTLGAIAVLGGTGIITMNGAGVVALRVVANSSTTTVTNPDGAAGNIQVNVTPSTSLQNVQVMLNGAIPVGVNPTSYINFVAGSGISIAVANATHQGNSTQDVTITSTGGGGGGGANALGYYLVTQSTNAPVNAINLGALGNGLLYQSVSGGVSTITPTNALGGATIYLGQSNPVRVGAASGGQVAALDVTGTNASFWIDQTSNSATIPPSGGVFTFDNTGKLSLTTSNANNKNGQVVVNSTGSTAVGDILLGNANGIMQSLAIGANNTVLTSNGTTATWAPLSITAPTGYAIGVTPANVGTANTVNYQTVTATNVITGSSAFNTLISNTSATGSLVINWFIRSTNITLSGSTPEIFCYFRIGSASSGAPSSTQMVNNPHGTMSTSGTVSSTSLVGITVNVPLADIRGAGNTSLTLYVYTSASASVGSFSLDFPNNNFECIYYPSGLL